MRHMQYMRHTAAPSRAERGLSLPVVMVIVLMTMLLAIGSARVTLFHELLIRNDADYQRAFEAAEAALLDAEMDIRGLGADGRGAAAVHFPSDTSELADMLALLDALPTGCRSGICRKRSGAQDFWNDPERLALMLADDTAARYGQYTGAMAGASAHPLFAGQDSPRAWYWVEVLPYAGGQVALLAGYEGSAHMAAHAPDPQRPWIYRITALARGRKKGTEVVLQSIVTLRPQE